MNPLKLIARILTPVHEPAGHQPRATDGPALLPPGAEMIKVKRYPEAERIAASLRDFPGDWGWRHKGYELEHTPSGFVMWVANEDYGLAEVANGGKAKFETGAQAVIWPSVEAWLASHKLGFTGRLPKVRVWCKGGAWKCVSKQHPWVGVGNTPEEAYRSWARAVSIEARTDQRPNEILHVWSPIR